MSGRRNHHWHTQRRTKPDLRARSSDMGASSTSFCDVSTVVTSETSLTYHHSPLMAIDRRSLSRSNLVDELHGAFNQDSIRLGFDDNRSCTSSSDEDERPGAYAISRDDARTSGVYEWDPTERSPDVDPLAETSNHELERSTRGNDSAIMDGGDAAVDYEIKLQRSRPWKERKCLIVLGLVVFLLCGAVVAAFILVSKGSHSSPAQAPINWNCDLSNSQELDYSIQCDCAQRVEQVTEEVASAYQIIVKDGNLSSWVESDVVMESCSYENLALLWVATDYAEAQERGVTYDYQTIRTRFALASLAMALEWENWEENANWMTSAGVCVWFGVKCDDGYRMNSLSLPANGLQGSLERKLGLIATLEVLNLSRNALFGSIPSEIFSLPSLVSLNLAKNKISGSFPMMEFSGASFSRLEELKVDWNQMTGVIPTSLERATSLKKIYLSSNGLTGTLPSFAGLSNLETIRLNATLLEGTIPESWGALTRLQTLDLSDMINVGGTFPSSLFRSPSIQYLAVTNTIVSGTIPESIGEMMSLEVIDFSNSKLGSTLPTTFGLLTNLVKLALPLAEISGTIPSEMSNCTRLEVFWLSYTDILTGTIPTELGSLSDLRFFNVEGTNLYGTVPMEFTNLSKLQTLVITKTQIVGPLPSGLCEIPSDPVVFVTKGEELGYFSDCECCEGRDLFHDPIEP